MSLEATAPVVSESFEEAPQVVPASPSSPTERLPRDTNYPMTTLPKASQQMTSTPSGSRSHPLIRDEPPDATADPRAHPIAVKKAYEKTNYWKFIKEKRYWPWWGLLITLAVLVILMTIYHRELVELLHPISAKIRGLSWGWVIPVLVLIVLSFPPLFGHEIVIVLCGAVYGLWIGFGIVAAGTFIGEIATFFAFRYILRRRADHLEHTNVDYGALARITREGGFLIVFIVRLSVIPGHFSTAVFATCGVNFWLYALASFITLPKQLVILYLGVIIGNPKDGRMISSIVLAITFAVTVAAGVYIWWKLRKSRRILLKEAEEELERERAQEMAMLSQATSRAEIEEDKETAVEPDPNSNDGTLRDQGSISKEGQMV